MTCENCDIEWRMITTKDGRDFIVGVREGLVAVACGPMAFLVGTQEHGLADVCHLNGWELK